MGGNKMDILKRSLAPLTSEVWDEIDGRAKEVLENYLTARKVVSVSGPKGWDYSVVTEGRLDVVDKKENGVSAATYKVKPLMEVRATFELDRWEMDNIVRGAKDIDLSPLEEAAEKIARYEEEAIFSGNAKAGIKGILETEGVSEFELGNSREEIVDAVTKGVLKLQKDYSAMPFTLVVSTETYRNINREIKGYPLTKQLKEIIGGEIVVSPSIEGALLVPENDEDLEMIIGQDLSIGYQYHDDKKVRLFITESFTFRVLDPTIIVKFK
jgi:uncharacterized linocin/CFP29 family protein